MDEEGKKTLAKKLARFAAEMDWGGAMRDALQKDQFELTHARQVVPKSWLLRAKPPQHLQEAFGLAPEILLIAVRGGVQSRDLQRAADEVVRSDLRLDSNLVIVTDDNPRPLQDRLDRMPGRDQRVAWVRADDGSWPPLSAVLHERVPTYNVFDERLPVRGYQLMGRDSEVMDLRTRVIRGGAVGVFGLRKVGKTSLVRAITDWLDPASGIKVPDNEEVTSQACVLWIDAEGLDQASVDDVADEMLSALQRRMRAAGVPYEPAAKPGVLGLKAASEALLDKGERLCFVIDEYDFLFEREGALGPVEGISRLFRLVRAWAQQWQGSVSLVLIGRDPEHLSAPQLDGVPNPLLAWLTPMWLGPLAAPRDTELLRKLGRRVGLDVGHETAALARTWTGGHPLLHRQFGSALREEIRQRDLGTTWKIPTDPYCAAAVDRFLGFDAVLTVDREIVALLSKRYPAAYDLLTRIVDAHDSRAVVAKSGGLHGAGARALRNFGLLSEATLTVPKHLAWYMQNLLPAPIGVAV
jgi:hypothetical protein